MQPGSEERSGLAFADYNPAAGTISDSERHVPQSKRQKLPKLSHFSTKEECSSIYHPYQLLGARTPMRPRRQVASAYPGGCHRQARPPIREALTYHRRSISGYVMQVRTRHGIIIRARLGSELEGPACAVVPPALAIEGPNDHNPSHQR